jgi:hypothetical protein
LLLTSETGFIFVQKKSGGFVVSFRASSRASFAPTGMQPAFVGAELAREGVITFTANPHG